MKILYVGRLFSGLESSLISGEWSPTGFPTIYRVIERLDRDFDLRLILADKDDARLWKNKSDCIVKVAKPNQDMRFDVPVVGVSTIEAMVTVF